MEKFAKVIFIGILFLAFLFRFYNFQNLFFFGMDQEYEALIVKNIVDFKHFPLIGVNASDTGLYLGPAFIYLAAVPFYIFRGNPLGWGLTASFLGVFTVYFIYKVGKKMFSKKVGFFASLLYSSSFLTSFYDRQFWNPTPIPLFSLLIGFLLYRILNNNRKSLLLLALSFGIAIQAHLSILIFLPLIIYAVMKKYKIVGIKTIFLSIIIFILLQTPIILFELRHNFLNTKAFINLVAKKSEQTSTSSFSERNSLFLSTLGRFFWVPYKPDLFLESGQCKELSSLRKNAYPEGIIMVMVGLIIFLRRYFSKNKFATSSKLILSICLLTFLFVLFYNRSIFEYYFLFFFPWLAIALGRSLDLIWGRKQGKVIVLPVIILFVVLNLMTLFSAYSSYSYPDKLEAMRFVNNYVMEKDYTLEALGNCPRFGGYRYLFEYFVGVPKHSYMDTYFEWLYPDVSAKKNPNRTVLLSLIDFRDKAEDIKRWEEEKFNFLAENRIVAKEKFGRIQVFILDKR